MRPTAPNAPLRPFQMAMLSSADWLMRRLRGAKGSQRLEMRERRSSCSATLPSTSMMSRASASSG